MSVRQADQVANRLRAMGQAWNRAWDGGAAMVSPLSRATVELPGGLRVTLLSPGQRELDRLAKQWRDSEERHSPESSASPEAVPEQAGEGGLGSAGAALYIASAHQDEQWRSRLVSALAIHLRPEQMFWDKARSVFPAWSKLEQHAIDNARVAVVLVSPAALASPLMKGAVPALVEAATKGRLTLTWILLEPCNWQSTFLAQYQALNDTRPLERLSEREATAELVQLADRLAALATAPAPRPSATRRQRGPDDAPIDVEALAATPFTADRSVANNASIAFLAEHHGKTLLVCGDASAEVLADSIRRLLPANGVRRLRVDAFVVPHNGSLGNLNRELLELLNCDRYLISSNGEVFRHPHREAVARILAFGRAEPDRPLTLVFNYRTQWTSVWDDPALKKRWNYQAIYPTVEGGGIKVRI